MFLLGMTTDKDTWDDDLNWEGEKVTASQYGVACDVIYRLHNSRLHPYVVAGAGVTIGKEKKECDHAEGQKPDIEEESSFTFLVRAILGAEFFFTKNMSLATEYHLGYTSTTEKDEDTVGATGDKTEFENSISTLGITTAARVILAIYFK
jgi:opacity protein-like surface antigen